MTPIVGALIAGLVTRWMYEFDAIVDTVAADKLLRFARARACRQILVSSSISFRESLAILSNDLIEVRAQHCHVGL